MNERKTPYVTVDMIIELPDGIVVIERKNPPHGWALPGGFVDIGESIEDAARREAKEETGLDLEALRQMHTYSDPKRDPRFHTISTVFIARGLGKPQSGDDAKNLKIVPFENLLKIEYAFDHKQVIQDYVDYRRPKEDERVDL
jgi:8-oxo-dGTP diphosphatase